jgi:nitrogenase molybdenum-iron protein alpha chain
MPTSDATKLDQVKDELVQGYPTKVARKRAKQVLVNRLNADGLPQEMQSNVRTVPGIITQRGCTYAGCKGVVLGPTRDIVNITHGPIGCGFYSWLTRRNQTRPPSADDENFMTYCFSTDLQEENIIFGGEKKLRAAVREAYDTFHPKAIGIFATCPVGLIGDDIHAVARDMKEELGINVFGFSCEGYKGVSQSAGHHIANNQLFRHIIGRNDERKSGEFQVNLLGEYNIGGDAFVLDEIFAKAGITLVATFSGNSTIDAFERAHTADLNAVMCHRSINYVADMIEKKFGVPWIKVNFIGANATAKALRKIGFYFQNKALQQRIEEVIAEEMQEVEKVREEVRARTAGKKVMLFVGGSRAHSYQELFKELGMEIVAAGYEFAHRDDYEGRRVLPTIKVDADSRNIEEITVEPDPERFQPRLSEEERAALTADSPFFKEYDGMMADMNEGSLVIDDISHYETERLIERLKPDLFCAGIKEKYVIQKMGIPCKQLHSYDYGGPYAGFAGAINFYREIDRMVNSPVNSLLKAPWEQRLGPTLEATYISA